MIEEWVLDDPEVLARADTSGVLLDLASAGATVRTAVRLAWEAGLDRLQPEGRPRAAFVAGHGAAALAGDLLAALVGGNCPVTVLRPTTSDESATRTTGYGAGLIWFLPGWTGPSDLLFVLSTTGTEPGLTSLIQQAYVRGCAVVVVAPADTPLAEAAVQTRGLPLPYVPSAAAPSAAAPGDRANRDGDLPRDAPSALWALLAPALALADRIGLAAAPPASLQAVADRLDEVAVRCRPGADTYGNPAKTLAVQLDGVLPLIWSDGPCTAAAALRFTGMLADQAGRPALSAMLPEALTTQRGLLEGQLAAGPSADDFFRDRTEETDGLQLKVLLLRRTSQPDAAHSDGAHSDAPQPDRADDETRRERRAAAPDAAVPSVSRHTLARAQRLADDHEVSLSELSSSHADALEALAELVALTDFAAVYLGLASAGADAPDAPDATDPTDAPDTTDPTDHRIR